MATAASGRRYLYRKAVKGNAYIYFRMPSGKLVRLPGDEQSSEFRRSYDACIAALEDNPAKPKFIQAADTRRVTFVGGTIGNAIDRYRQSPEFAAKKLKTRTRYQYALGVMRDRLGTARLSDLDTDGLDIYTEQLAKEFGSSVSDLQVYLVSNLWQVCRKYPEFDIKKRMNPAIDAVRRYKVKEPAKPWSEEAQDQFMRTAPAHLKLAKLLLHFSAQRGGDCVKMKWSDFDGRGLFVVPEKDSGGVFEPNYHLCPKPLLDALLARQAEGGLADTILTTMKGTPWASASNLSDAIRDHLLKIGLASKGKKTLTMHGLRKNAASEVGALLVGTAGIKSVTGHRSNEMAEYYARHAEQIALNERVVERWNQAIVDRTDARAGGRRAKLKRVK